MKDFLRLGTFLTELWSLKQLPFDVFESYKAILEVTRIFVANLTFCSMYVRNSNFQVDLQQCIEYFYNFKEPVLVSFLGYKKAFANVFQTFFSISVRRSRRILKYVCIIFQAFEFFRKKIHNVSLEKMQIAKNAHQTLQKVVLVTYMYQEGGLWRAGLGVPEMPRHLK